MTAPVVIVVPEPCDWLAPLLDRLPALTGGDLSEVELVAPWMIENAPPWLPGRLKRAMARRRPPPLGSGVALATPPVWRAAWPVLEAAAGTWAGTDVARRLRARFAIRRVVDAIAVGRVRRAEVVIAPSGCAERVFSRAPASCRRILVTELPSLRRLHEDLDAAAAVHPDARFLKRFRAPAREVARQEAERVLADQILVRGAYARDALIAAGIPERRVVAMAPTPAEVVPRRSSRDALRILLAGGGAARGGSYEALAALDALPGATLIVSPGEGREPAHLMSHPRVRATRAGERERLQGIDVVIAPAWCESYPREVSLARALGVPVVATAQAAGFGPALVKRGDPRGLAEALMV